MMIRIPLPKAFNLMLTLVK